MKKMKELMKRIVVVALAITMTAGLVGIGTVEALAGAASGPAIGFEADENDSLVYKVKPGASTRITIYADYIGDFDTYHSFSLSPEIADDSLTFSDLSIIPAGSTTILGHEGYPSKVDNSSGSTDVAYTYLGGGRYRIEFNVQCSDNLEKGDHSVILMGTKRVDKYMSPIISTGTDTYKVISSPLLKFVLENNYSPKSASATIDSITYNKGGFSAGTNQEFSIKVTNNSSVDISKLYVTADLDMKDIFPAYDLQSLRAGELKAGASRTIKVPVIVAEGAKSGMKDVTFTITGSDKYGNAIDPLSETLFVTIGGSAVVTDPAAPNITITTKQNYKTLKPGTEEVVKLKLTNSGNSTASKVKVAALTGFGVGDGLTKNFTTPSLEVGDIAAGKTVTVEFPFTVTNSFSKGIHELSFEASYQDSDKVQYTSDVMTMYVEHYLTDSAPDDDTVRTYIQISNVKQSPSIPMAGDKVTITFDVKNKGNAKITDLHFYGTGLSSAGFEPVSSEPYQNEGSLDVNAKKTVTMNFRAGEDIPKGVNSLAIGYDFLDANYEAHNGSTTVYILNVSNSKFDDIDVGRPKIIVSDYTTDPDEIKAGSVFDFSYTLKNTHQTKAAKNIKITLSQDEGVFAPAEGTNIFYIEKMEPGEESVLSIPLKTKGDTATGDYAVKLMLEYEYDDMSAIDKEHGGVAEENIIKIHAVENYRPEIENIYIDSYMGIYVGQPVDLSFEFYNMGKSTLGNVYITIEGDFELANNSAMSYVGAVQGYGQEFLNPQIVPLVAGEAFGTVTIHFEDSNGDEQTKSAEFSAFVEDMAGGFEEWDPSFDPEWDPSFDPEWDPSMEGEEGDGTGFFASIPWWGYVIAGVVVVGGAAVLTIVLVKKSKKRKLAKEEEEEDDEDI